MADDTPMLRTIDWRSVFPFTLLFRGFRVAIHPSKLILALAAILLIYLAGRALDAVWPTAHRAVPGEAVLYWKNGGGTAFSAAVTEARRSGRDFYNTIAGDVAAEQAASTTQPAVAADKMTPRQLRAGLIARRDVRVAAINAAFDKSEKTDADRARRDADLRNANQNLARTWADIRAVNGESLLLEFLSFQTRQVHGVVVGVLGFNWLGADGVLSCLHRFVFVGPVWAVTKHPVYFGLLGVFSLLVMSIFGGAIARIAAVHVARDEKISVREALRFSLAKLLSFASAPVLPAILIGIFSVVLALAGWLSEMPVVGPVVTLLLSLVFILVIGVSILLACALVGTVAGAGLMYPTIAVEGSDSFDAISRSFSYVFARPWRLAFYLIVSVVYAALTYVFLRFMVYLTLSLSHGMLTAWSGDAGPDGSTSLANVWNPPASMLDDLFPPVGYVSLTLTERISGVAVSFWAYFLTTLLGAYLLSLYISMHTIMYYLLRLDVDVTELDDVYLEPSDDELDDLSDPVNAEAPPATPTTTTDGKADIDGKTEGGGPGAPQA
jgi:hypothetical protein